MFYRGISIAFLACLVAGAANAQFLMSGQITTSTGNFTAKRVNATSANVAQTAGGALDIPAQAFKLSGFSFRTFLVSTSIAQVASSFTASNAQAVLSAGGGPGAFSWCPGTSPIVPCTDPDAGLTATRAGLEGLLVYSAGGGYGGTFQLARNISNSSLARKVTGNQYSHSSPNANTKPWGGGLAYSAMHTTSAGGNKIITAGAVLGTQGSIQTLAVTGGGAPSTVGTSPATPPRFVTGFPATTGMLFAFDRKGSGKLSQSWTGSDARNANGHGNITLVASGYSNNLQGEVFPHRLTVAMTISPPVPSMNSVGVASLGILILAAGAVALRRNRR